MYENMFSLHQLLIINIMHITLLKYIMFEFILVRIMHNVIRYTFQNMLFERILRCEY